MIQQASIHKKRIFIIASFHTMSTLFTLFLHFL